MQGTILILDGVATNRIMLKVQLSAAYYHVVQSDSIEGLLALARRTRPDLIVTAMALRDGDARAVRQCLVADPDLARTPIIAVTPQNDHAARLSALRCGIDDVLSHPLDDTVLQARIRNLIRARGSADDLRLRDAPPGALGFAEPEMPFASRMPSDSGRDQRADAASDVSADGRADLAPGGSSCVVADLTAGPPERVTTIAVVSKAHETAAQWCRDLQDRLPHTIQAYRIDDIHDLMQGPAPSAIILQLAGPAGHAKRSGLQLLADLRAGRTTRDTAIIAVVPPNDPKLIAEALDRGAHDVAQNGFPADELALRVTAQLHRKARSDSLRDTVRDGLRAAIRDPLTGLYNRRYALPQLARIAREAAETGKHYAIMLADLDHFKRVNDTFGHPVGDAVLVEAAERLHRSLRPQDMIARVGGEEFMIVMPDTTPEQATRLASRLCARINRRHFEVPGHAAPIAVTTSIGVVIVPPPAPFPQPLTGSERAGRDPAALIGQADQALYCAKGAGRNQVTLVEAAA